MQAWEIKKNQVGLFLSLFSPIRFTPRSEISAARLDGRLASHLNSLSARPLHSKSDGVLGWRVNCSVTADLPFIDFSGSDRLGLSPFTPNSTPISKYR
jgi:hypothetical protein